MGVFPQTFDEAPDITAFRDSKPTLLVSWWCALYAITIIFARIFGRYVRAEKIFLEDGLMLLAITPILIRVALVHVMLVYGTNNTKTEGLSDDAILRREIGSQLVLASRIFYAASLWAIKYSVSIFLCSLTESVWRTSHKRLLRYLHIFLALTFFGTILSDFIPCRPFSNYWQVIPDPGPQCRQGQAYLLTFGIMNSITNLALVLFPLPMILRSQLPTKRKFTISLRLALPLLQIGFTAYAIPHIVSKHYSQTYRSLIASLDILLAAFISNAVVLTSLLQDRGYKKSKYKHGLGKEGLQGRGVKGRQGGGDRWGSDEDLMRDGGSGWKRRSGIALETFGKSIKVDSAESSPSDGGLQVPEKAKMITVASSWEVQVEIEDHK